MHILSYPYKNTYLNNIPLIYLKLEKHQETFVDL